MEPFRLKMKVGSHEFEAEGDQETVERQLLEWKALILAVPAAVPVAVPVAVTVPVTPSPAAPATPPAQTLLGTVLGKVFKQEDRIVTLTALPTGPQAEADASLLLLLGYRDLTQEELVTGGRILQGLQRSGMSVQRADRVFGDYMDRFVIRVGVHRAVRYRLTNQGMLKAQELAKELAQMVA